MLPPLWRLLLNCHDLAGLNQHLRLLIVPQRLVTAVHVCGFEGHLWSDNESIGRLLSEFIKPWGPRLGPTNWCKVLWRLKLFDCGVALCSMLKTLCERVNYEQLIDHIKAERIQLNRWRMKESLVTGFPAQHSQLQPMGPHNALHHLELQLIPS